MKINWNKIVASTLLVSSVTKEANAINFNYNSNLEKTFEVAEIQPQSLVNQEFTDVYSSPITPYTLKDAACLRMCQDGWVRAMASCAALANPLLIVGCQVGASLGLAACIALCPD
jgi:hypothetical protein